MVKAVLFDVDNTLIDFAIMKEKCCEAAIDAMISAGLRSFSFAKEKLGKERLSCKPVGL